MTTEKVEAFSESWTAMTLEATRANVALTTSFFRMLWFPWLRGSSSSAADLHNAALDVLDKGMDPVHRRAMANARRLTRTKLR